jgi:hypothetical protein
VRSTALLREWGIDASGHRPAKLTRELCLKADAIFVRPTCIAWFRNTGKTSRNKAYLFADPFSKPVSFGNGEYRVHDPSFDNRTTSELVPKFAWMRERVLQIRLALFGMAGGSCPQASTWSCAKPWIERAINDARGRSALSDYWLRSSTAHVR